MTKMLALVPLSALLFSGCSLLKPRIVEVPLPVFPPQQLLEDCDNPELKAKVYSDLVSHIIDQNEAIEHCSLDKSALREWARSRGMKNDQEN